MPSCKYCNIPLIWKKPYTKGDRPVEVGGLPHNCPKFEGNSKQTFQKQNVFKEPAKHGYKTCPYCEGKNNVYFKKGTSEMEDHIKIFHPNGEVKDADFIMNQTRFVSKTCFKCERIFFHMLSFLEKKPIQYICDRCK